MEIAKTLDTAELEARVTSMYREVAEVPATSSTSKQGASSQSGSVTVDDLDRSLQTQSSCSPARWWSLFDLIDLQPGETVLDLGSGSGTDAFVAALRVGERDR